MTALQHIAVIDIGKTNAKLALVDLETLTERAVITCPNTVVPGPPWPHFDVDGHWAFLLEGLKQFHRAHRIDAISVTTHGASVALLDANGDLAAPILDYEHTYPPEIVAAYRAMRPDFTETGSPLSAGGLNVGAQLHFQFATDPSLHARAHHIFGYPQYWGHRLTGNIAYDVTSIGCHTDLWNPMAGQLSSLAERLDLTAKIAPVFKPEDILGTVLPQIADKTGLSPKTPVACGIHDSNASLYPHLLSRSAPFSVVSTGTWVIAMAIDGQKVTLNPNRDTLINVNALGNPVPSAKFMGGREFELIQQGQAFGFSENDVQSVLDDTIMLLPAVDPNTGPFQGREMEWVNAKPPESSGQRSVAVSFYLALMTGVCLDQTGAAGTTIIEGPFARNPLYLDMLRALTRRPVLSSQSATGTSIGAAMLFGSGLKLDTDQEDSEAFNPKPLKPYIDAWTEKTRY